MNKIKFIFLVLALGVLFSSCGNDDNDDENMMQITEDFKTEWNGQDFSTSDISVLSVFGTTSIVLDKDGEELSIILSGLEEGRYEVGGTDKNFTASYGFYTEDSGYIEITENNTENETIMGTFDFVLRTGVTSTEPTIELKNGEFVIEY